MGIITGSSQEVGYERKISISIISILISQLKVKCLEKLTSCFLLFAISEGLEGKYIAAQICFLFCKGACSSLCLENDLTGSHNWIYAYTDNTHIYISSVDFPLNSKLIHPTIYQTSPLGSPHFKCNKLKNKLILWTYFLFQICSSYRLPHYS